MESSSTELVILPNKAKIWVEATRLRHAGDKDVAQIPSKGPFEIESVQEAIEGIGTMVVGSLHKLAPSKVSAEFELEVGLESGKLIALWVKGTGKANLKIKLEWGGDNPPNPK